MPFVESLQLEMPTTFPAAEYEGFMTAAKSVLLPIKTDAWKEFAGASNLIGWRFRGAAEYMDEYLESWNKLGSNVGFEELYKRERSLFGMFSSAVSCLESTSYALYALASHPAVLGVSFREAEQRKCNPLRLRNALASHARASLLVSALSAIIDSQELALLIDFRNRMTHRSNIPRVIYGAMGSELPLAKALQFAATSSSPAWEADASHLGSLFFWIASSLGRVLNSGEVLASHP